MAKQNAGVCILEGQTPDPDVEQVIRSRISRFTEDYAEKGEKLDEVEKLDLREKLTHTREKAREGIVP